MKRSAVAVLLSLLVVSQEALQEVVAPAAPPVRGVVVDEAGRPLEGVRWWVSGHEQLQGGAWVLTHFLGIPKVERTGADGSIEVPAREGLRYDVDLDAEGFAPAFLRRLEHGDQPRVVLRRGHSVAGRVVQRLGEGERALGNVTVELQRPNPRGVWFTSRRSTDPGGRFAFEGFLPIGSEAAAGGAWRLVCAGAHLDLEADRVGPIEDLLVEVSVSREGG